MDKLRLAIDPLLGWLLACAAQYGRLLERCVAGKAGRLAAFVPRKNE